jgi:hypothetical protein
MVRKIAILAAFTAAVALAGCVQKPEGGKVGKVSQNGADLPKPLLVQYTDAIAKKANALFNDTIQTRAAKAGERAADEARNDAANSDFKRVTGDQSCEEDCAGHDTGYAWAKVHKTEKAVDCPNDKGEAFEEGCRAYGEYIQGARDDAKSAVLNGKDPPS